MKLLQGSWNSCINSGLKTSIVRRLFLEYFINEHHYEYMKSVSTASHFDPSTYFVYSGTCQFTRVFTGDEPFNLKKISGVQKCVKMNADDESPETVPNDPHKLSFFEMPSYWSRCSNLQKESCKLSWNFLTTVLKLDPKTLKVSYFSGDDKLALPADEITRQTWLELGIPASRLLPHDKTNNWWKLGDAGPCGSCTKIYVTLPENSGLLELWNIGFINVDGVLEVMPDGYISAGLGLERLMSVLQKTYSCYHIDSFVPLFVTMQKISGAPEYNGKFDKLDLNAKYRQLADSIRTITVAVSDDVFPDTNIEMKRLIRKALYIARIDFKQDTPHLMLVELSARVAETLQETYPEIGENLNKVRLTIENEEKIIEENVAEHRKWWQTARELHPFLQSQSSASVENSETDKFFHHIVDFMSKSPTDKSLRTEILEVREKFNISNSIVDGILAHFCRNISWNRTSVRKRDYTLKSVAVQGLESIETCLRNVGIISDDTLKHNFSRNDDGYTFPDVRARLLAIVDNEMILSVHANRECLSDSLKKASYAEVSLCDRELGFVCDRTNFITEQSGLCHDIGYIVLDRKYTFKVNCVKKVRNLVIHYAEPLLREKNVKLKAGVEATLSIDAEHRLKLMRNHTLSHLILIALKEISPVVYSKRLKCDHEYCHHSVSVLGKDVDIYEFGELLELKIQDYIRRRLPIFAKQYATSFEILREPNVSYRPNLIYPYQNIRLVGISDENGSTMSQELCDAVHVSNTGDIGRIMVPFINYIKRKRLYVTGITEPVIQKAQDLQTSVRSETALLQDEANSMMNGTMSTDQLIRFSEKLHTSWYRIAKAIFFTPHLILRSTYADAQKIKSMISDLLSSELLATPSEVLVKTLRSRIEESASVDKFTIYFCTLPIPSFKDLSFIVDILYRTNFPALFLSYHRRKVSGVCHVPEHYVSDHFNAEIWMSNTVKGFPNKLEIKEEADNSVFCYLKGEHVKYYSVIDYIESLTSIGRMVAEKHFIRHPENMATSLQDRS